MHKVAGCIFFTSPQNQLHVPLMLGEPDCGPEPSCTSPTAAQVLEQDSNATSMTISLQKEHKLQNQCIHTCTFPSPSETSVALILASIRKYRGCPSIALAGVPNPPTVVALRELLRGFVRFGLGSPCIDRPVPPPVGSLHSSGHQK